MRKMYWLGLVLILSVLLYGCAGKTETPEPTTVPTVENTEAAAAPTEIISPTATEVADCQPYNLLNDVLPVAAENLPPISEDGDHILGPEGAKMVILEYSDFQ